jgi:hypothetical protein
MCVCFCESALDSYGSGEDAVAGSCGHGDEPSVTIPFTETFDFVSNHVLVVLTKNFVPWTELQYHETFIRFCTLSTDGSTTHVQVPEVRTRLHNTTHSTRRMVLDELYMEVVQLFRSVGLILAHSVQGHSEALYAVLIILSS